MELKQVGAFHKHEIQKVVEQKVAEKPKAETPATPIAKEPASIGVIEEPTPATPVKEPETAAPAEAEKPKEQPEEKPAAEVKKKKIFKGNHQAKGRGKAGRNKSRRFT